MVRRLKNIGMSTWLSILDTQNCNFHKIVSKIQTTIVQNKWFILRFTEMRGESEVNSVLEKLGGIGDDPNYEPIIAYG